MDRVIIWIVLLALAYPVMCLIGMMFRNGFMEFSHSISQAVALVPSFGGHVGAAAGRVTSEQAADDAADLTAHGDIPAWRAFIVPVFLAIACSLFILTDLGLAALGLDALLNKAGTDNNFGATRWIRGSYEFLAGNAALFAAPALIVASAVWGFVAMELRNGAMPGPYRLMPIRRLRLWEVFCWSGAILSAVATALFYGWREGRILSGAGGANQGALDAGGLILVILMGVVVIGGTALTIWSIPQTLAIVWVLMAAIAGWVCAGWTLACRYAVRAVDLAHAILVQGLDFLLAERGRSLWNWLVSFDRIAATMHLRNVEFRERPRIVADF